MAATNKRGVFSLEKVLERQGDSNWTNILDPFIYVDTYTGGGTTNTPAPPGTGYFAGGVTNNNFTTVDRIDFDNDTATASPKGNLNYARGRAGGAGNLTHGYIFGGEVWSGTSYSYIERVQYSNDTATTSNVSNLSNRNYWYGFSSSVGNNSYGYTGGSDNGGPPAYTGGASILDRLDYANDTTTASARGSGIFDPKGHGTGATGDRNYGYFGGGYHGTLGTLSSIRKLDYANDTATMAPAGPLSGSARYKGATGNGNYGYYNIGAAGSGSNGSAICRLDFASDTTTASSKGPLNNSQTTNTAATGDNNFGYFGGRSSGYPINNWYSTVSRIDYENDTNTALSKGNLSQQRFSCISFSAKENGNPQSASSTPNPISFTPATQYEPPLPPPVPSGPAYGYSGGGGAGTSGTRETGGTLVQRINFASDTAIASGRGNLAHDHLHGGAFGNTTHGYVMGDLMTTTPRSWVSRVTYASDSSTASPRGSLTVARGGGSATGNASYAWFSGAWDWIYHTAGPNASVVDRIDFANDSNTALARGNLDRAVGKVSASGNANYGWWYGGLGHTAVSRVDYGNDTATASPKGTMSANVNENTAVGNINYGYTTRGNNSYTDFLRYDYANDTGASTPKGSLSFARNDFAGATGSQSYGYFMGGTTFPTYYTSIDRIDYANDTATASPKGNLSATIAGSTGQRRAGGFSGQSNAFGGTPTAPSTTKLVDKGSDGYLIPAPSITTTLGPAFGYVLGGGTPSNTSAGSTIVQRSEFASDTSNLTPRGDLSREIFYGGGTSSMTHGYVGGDNQANNDDTGVKFNYANDTSTLVPNWTFQRVRNRTAVGNTNFGYWMGGDASSTLPDNSAAAITRIDYSNDTAGGVKSGLLASAYSPGSPGYVQTQSHKCATGNADFGWIAGGMGRSRIERMDYANDTAMTLLKGNTGFNAPSTGNGGLSAMGNEFYGWFGGAMDYGPAAGQGGTSYVNRIDFANDSNGASFRTALNSSAFQSGGGYFGDWSSPNYGWLAGGNTTNNYYGPGTSYLQRLDFANDAWPSTMSTRGNLPTPVFRSCGFSAQMNANAEKGTSYIPRMRFVDDVKEGFGSTPAVPEIPAPPSNGYFTGGDGGPTRVQRMDFDNDTATASPKGNLSQQHQRGGGTGNLTHGYTIAGIGNSFVDRVTYASDTSTASPRGRLATTADYISSVGNNDFAYTGGRPWGNFNITGKIDYANDTQTETILNPAGFAPSGTSSAYGYAAVGNRNYGYFVGGYNVTVVRRLDYSNDTAATVAKGPLSSVCPYASGTGNGNFGYINPAHPAFQSQIERINYANDSASTEVKGPLTGGSSYRAATGDNNYGYWAGGTPSTYGGSNIYRVDYASDTGTASPKGNLSNSSYRQQGFSAKENGNPQSKIPAVPFFAGVQAPFQPPFPFPRPFPPLTSGYAYSANGRAYGIVNPYGWSVFSNVDRIDLSNDTATAVSRTPTPQETTHGGSASSHTHGYMFGGGLTQHITPISTIIRLDYSNDTLITTVGSLTETSDYTSSVGNQYYGYNHTTTSPSGTKIDRLDYANDSATALTRGPLANGNWSKGTMGTQSHGYWAGGYFGSTVDRIAYANDTATSLTRGNLSTTYVGAGAGVSNGAEFGYIVGGGTPSPTTRIDRIEFANDTVQATPKGNLTVSVSSVDIGTGTQYAGYIVGGYGDTPSGPEYAISTIQKMDYANDTQTASPSGNLTARRYGNRVFSPFQNGLSS